jgi:predicted AlkP superfamily pyrophosphatase or phosphodiesterase
MSERLGPFPLFNFWGPTADITSSRWIGDCVSHVEEKYAPTLNLVYLPHLDYDLQRYGPNDPRIGPQVRLVDEVCGRLIERAERAGVRVLVISEYGMSEVGGVVNINRVLRRAGWLKVREEMGRELLDAGASEAFAVADHQLAHVYVSKPELIAEVKATLESLPGVERVLDAEGKRELGLDHPRSGELVAISRKDRWFTYYYWIDDDRAPDFARTVEIHRKPGYDPVELFLDPTLMLPAAQVGWRLLKKAAGFRTLMDVIPLDPSLVRGSHGRLADDVAEGPLVIGSHAELLPEGSIDAVDVKRLILRYLFESSRARDATLREAS